MPKTNGIPHSIHAMLAVAIIPRFSGGGLFRACISCSTTTGRLQELLQGAGTGDEKNNRRKKRIASRQTAPGEAALWQPASVDKLPPSLARRSNNQTLAHAYCLGLE